MFRFCALARVPIPLIGPFCALAIGQRELLVAVGVVVRRHEEDHRLQPVLVLPHRELAQQHQRGFLALDFAGVHVRLDVHAQLAARLDRRRARVLQPGADDRHRHRPPLGRRAVGRVEDERRRLVHRLHELDDVVVGGRRLVARGLGRGLQVGERRFLLGVGRQDGDGTSEQNESGATHRGSSEGILLQLRRFVRPGRGLVSLFHAHHDREAAAAPDDVDREAGAREHAAFRPSGARSDLPSPRRAGIRADSRAV